MSPNSWPEESRSWLIIYMWQHKLTVIPWFKSLIRLWMTVDVVRRWQQAGGTVIRDTNKVFFLHKKKKTNSAFWDTELLDSFWLVKWHDYYSPSELIRHNQTCRWWLETPIRRGTVPFHLLALQVPAGPVVPCDPVTRKEIMWLISQIPAVALINWMRFYIHNVDKVEWSRDRGRCYFCKLRMQPCTCVLISSP